MNRFFKRRKARLSIIPHSSEGTKHSQFLFILIPAIFLVLFSVTAYLFVMSVINLKNINKYVSVKKTKEEVNLLSIKDNELKEKMENIEGGVKKLKSELSTVIPIYQYMSGIIKTDSNKITLSSNLDSLLLITRYLTQVSDSSIKYLSERKRYNFVPSLVPVNGWILRGFGKVNDPYTQTIKTSTGTLFISETEEKVFATAEGVIVFAGLKDKNGSTIIIDHGGYQTHYSHISNILVSVGSKVKKGQHIAYAGKTGKTLSSSLFYKIMKKDTAINPESSFQIPVYMLYDTLTINL